MKIRFLISLVVLFTFSSFSFGEGKEDVPKEKILKLSLKKCILLTLQMNLEIHIESYNPRIFDTEVDKALSGETGGGTAFDPILRASGQHTSVKTPTFVDAGAVFLGIGGNKGAIISDKTKTWNFNVSLEQRFLTGTSYLLSYGNNYRKIDRSFGLNPSYRPKFSLKLTQPLLKGFGFTANEAEIKISRNNRHISDELFKLKAIFIMEKVESRYWDVVQAQQNLILKNKSLSVAKDLLRITKLRLKLGTVPAIEVTAAKSGLATRQAEIIDAKNRWKNSSDQLASLFLHPEKLRKFNQIILPLNHPKTKKETVNLESKILLALKYRGELNQSQWEFENKKILFQNSWNKLLPQLDISLGGTLNGLGSTFGESLSQIRPSKFYDWDVSAVFSYPLFQRLAKSRYKKARLEKKQAFLKILVKRRDIFLQVRQAVRNLLTAHEAFLSRREASKFTLEKLRAERTRHSVGKSTNHKVFQIEEEYTGAKTSEIEARISIARARLALEMATGTLLKHYKIQIGN